MVQVSHVIIGILALLGALLVGKSLLMSSSPPPRTVSGLQASYEITPLSYVTMPAPCVAAALPLTNCAASPVDTSIPSRNDLYPGSYTNFGLYNTGCDGNSHRRC